jgi:Calpain family cysteine protease
MGSPAIARVLQLQRTAGNAAVGRLLREVIQDIEVPAAVNHTRPGAATQDDHALRHLRHRGHAFVRDRHEDASGADPSDIRQGNIGDCFFLSPLMATVRINPRRIANMVRRIGESPSGGDAYEVKLYNADGDLVTHHVDDRFVSNADDTPAYAQYGDRASDGGQELWVMLMEKAWAAQRGGFNNLDFGQASDGLMAVSGKRSTWHRIANETSDQILNNIWQAVQDGKPVIPITPGPITTAALAWAAAARIPLVPSHAYNVERANRSDREIDVANPHGRNHLRALSPETFRMIFDWYLVSDSSVA